MTFRWKYQTWAATVAESELKWWRKEFLEAYQAHAENGGAQMLGGNVKLKQLAAGITKSL